MTVCAAVSELVLSVDPDDHGMPRSDRVFQRLVILIDVRPCLRIDLRVCTVILHSQASVAIGITQGVSCDGFTQRPDVHICVGSLWLPIIVQRNTPAVV